MTRDVRRASAKGPGLGGRCGHLTTWAIYSWPISLAFPGSTQYILAPLSLFVDTFSLPTLHNKVLRVETVVFFFFLPFYQSLAYCLQYCRNSSIYPIELSLMNICGPWLHSEGFMLSDWVMVRSHSFWAPWLTENMFYSFRKKNQWRGRSLLNTGEGLIGIGSFIHPVLDIWAINCQGW